MCGIAGQVDFSKPPSLVEVGHLVQGIRHRGPDDFGLWSSSDGHCALGHARLSVIDLSPLGHQPMVDPETGNAIVFNGEVYNFRELRQRCQNLGDRFRSESDTEVILALYRRCGIDCLDQLRGMFALAIWNSRERSLFLARDRMGKKPLHYALTPSGVVFCSELSPLSRHREVASDLDPEALELYLQLQAVPAPWSIYQQIRKLPPAHCARVTAGGCELKRYWQLDYRAKLELDDDEALEAFEAKLTDAVRLRLVADVPLGALLSGGVDSSVIVAIMAKLCASPVRTFSIGFEEQEFNELPYAATAASTLGTEHTPEVVRGEVAALLPELAQHYGEPYADSSAVPSFFVARSARRHVTVVLNGDGGDELLGGYPRYAVPDWSIKSGTWLGRFLGPKRLVALMPLWANARSFPARALRRAARDLLSPELGGLLMFMGCWNDQLRAELLGPLHQQDLLQQWRLKWLDSAFIHGTNPIDRMLWLDNHTYLPNDLLVKMDIATMHCGLEARSPLLDHELIEFAARLPVRFKVRRGVGKCLLKRLAEKYFPTDFVHRKKMGFGIPLAAWLLGPLRAHAEEVLFAPDLMAPLAPSAIRASWNRLQAAGRGPSADAEAGRVWALLMYGQWRGVCPGRHHDPRAAESMVRRHLVTAGKFEATG